MHSPIVCNGEVVKGHLRMGLKPQLEKVSSRQLLGQAFVLWGAKWQQGTQASPREAGSEPGGTGLRGAWADIQGARQRGQQILSQGLPLTRVMGNNSLLVAGLWHWHEQHSTAGLCWRPLGPVEGSQPSCTEMLILYSHPQILHLNKQINKRGDIMVHEGNRAIPSWEKDSWPVCSRVLCLWVICVRKELVLF